MFARRGNGWTERDDEIIRTMAAADASAFLVAAKLKRSVSAVKKRARSMKIHLTPHQSRGSTISRANASFSLTSDPERADKLRVKPQV